MIDSVVCICITTHYMQIIVWYRQTVWLSTSPSQPLTHWYQIRCLFTSPVMGKTGQIVTGAVTWLLI